MIDSVDDYSPELDEPALSVREVGELLAEIGDGADLRMTRRFVRLLCNGQDAEAAWKTSGLADRFGPYDEQEPGTLPSFLGRPRALFGR